MLQWLARSNQQQYSKELDTYCGCMFAGLQASE